MNLYLQLKQAFGEMSEGTKIISTKAFCPVDFKINDRNAGNDIGSIMRKAGKKIWKLEKFLTSKKNN